MSEFESIPATQFDIETLARLYTRTFEGYVYKAIITPAQLESFIYVEDLKLDLSPVLRVGHELVAFTTVGLRGEHAYCRGFGVIPEYRGKGLAYALCEEMIANAWSAGATDMVLGVLKDNHGAVKTYSHSGFRPLRELHSVEWVRDGTAIRNVPSHVREIAPAQALNSFSTFHTVPAIWNRDLPSLGKMTGVHGLAVWDGDVPRAYVLYRAGGDNTEILDLAGAAVSDGVDLLHAIQCTSTHIVCHAEPEPRLMHAAFREAGFMVTQRRWEMEVKREG